MNLPDKIVIDIKNIDLVVDKISDVLKNIIKLIKCGDITDVGNDVEYSLKQLLSFKKNLIKLVRKESKKYETDIFGNTIKPIRNYQYAEMLFSQNYKEINSLRLFGKNRNNSFSRYTLFNLDNIFDPNLIWILFNFEDILEEIQTDTNNEIKYIEFLQKYFVPFPIIHKITQKSKKCVDNASKKYDTNKPKSFEEKLKQDKEFGSYDFKLPIFDARENSTSLVGDISFLLPNIDDLSEKIQTFQNGEQPDKLINLLYTNILDKYKPQDILEFVFDNFNIQQPNIFAFWGGLSPIDIITKVDELPKNDRVKIYDFLRDKNTFPEFDNVFTQLETRFNSALNLLDKNTRCSIKFNKKKHIYKLSGLFSEIKIKVPKLYIDFETDFNNSFPKVDFLRSLPGIINFELITTNIPKIDIPNFKIPSFDFDINDLFGDFSKQLDTLVLNGISFTLSNITKNLLDLLNSLNKLDDFAFENIFPLPELNIPNGKSKFEAAFNEEWLLYISYVYELILETDKLKTLPQTINLPPSISNNQAIRTKIKSKSKPKTEDNCQPTSIPEKLSKNKKRLLSLQAKNSLLEIANSGDVETLLEKIKNFFHSSNADFFITESSEDETVIDILRLIARSLRENPPQQKPPLPVSPQVLISSVSDMVEQIEGVLNQQEMNSLLNGTYTEETAQIVRNIAKLNFPDLTYKVDPIKYFRMLGKVVGSSNLPKQTISNTLRVNGIKK